MIIWDLVSEYAKNKGLCRIAWIWYEKHDNNEKWDTNYVRFDIYTDKDYRCVRKLFPHYSINKAHRKTIGGQNQYLVSYKIKK